MVKSDHAKRSRGNTGQRKENRENAAQGGGVEGHAVQFQRQSQTGWQNPFSTFGQARFDDELYPNYCEVKGSGNLSLRGYISDVASANFIRVAGSKRSTPKKTALSSSASSASSAQ